MNSIDFVGTVIVGVCVVAVDGSVVVVVNCVNIDKCTEKAISAAKSRASSENRSTSRALLFFKFA